MAFFRKWKTHYKHKKFTSEDAVDNEESGLDKSIKAISNIEDMKLDFDCNLTDNNDDDDDQLFEMYNIKYLGCTPIETKRSEKVTSEAIKTVISNSKAGGRKNKNQKNVMLNVSQSGIEVLDQQTRETLMRFSIYKISYCSVDAAHDHTFSFVGSEKDPLSEREKMSCHVFQCPKRKIAHEITLTVARCFEKAYQLWRDTVVQHAKSQGINLNNIDNLNMKNILKEQNSVGFVESRAEVNQHKDDERKSENLLIDLAASDNEVRAFLQNSWVSFDDDPRDNVQIVAC